MNIKRTLHWSIALLVALPLNLMAQSWGRFRSFTQIYAGPNTSYPIVGEVQPDTSVLIYGCLEQTPWCDVQIGADRGWARCDELWVSVQGREQLLSEVPYGWMPTTIFVLDGYWANHYRQEPWYHDHDRYDYEQHHPEPRRYDHDEHHHLQVHEHHSVFHQTVQGQDLDDGKHHKDPRKAKTKEHSVPLILNPSGLHLTPASPKLPIQTHQTQDRGGR